MTKYRYIYFNVKGRAEVIRYIFAQVGVKYEDKRVEFSDWPALKPSSPFGQLPVLDIDGKQLAQTTTIARYLAKEFGLTGKTSVEQAIMDSVADELTDMREKYIDAFMEKDEELKQTKTETFNTKTLPEILGYLENFLCNNKGGDGWFVGDKLSWTDLYFFAILELVGSKNEGVLNDFPKMKALYQKVAEQPKIAAYIKSRPETTM